MCAYENIFNKSLLSNDGRVRLYYAMLAPLTMWIKNSAAQSLEKDIVKYSCNEEFPFKEQLIDYLLFVDPTDPYISCVIDNFKIVWEYILNRYYQECQQQKIETLDKNVILEQNEVINRQTFFTIGKQTHKITNGYDDDPYAQKVYINGGESYIIWPTNPRKKKYRGRIGKIIGYNGTDPRNVLSTPIDTVRFKFKDSGQVAYIPVVDLCYSSQNDTEN
jgi:hypothetical protein